MIHPKFHVYVNHSFQMKTIKLYSCLLILIYQFKKSNCLESSKTSDIFTYDKKK